MPFKAVELQRAANRACYKKHRVKRVRRIRERQREITEWFREAKRASECKECGEDHEATLDYHHRDRTSKLACLSRAALRLGWSKLKLLEEMAKCDVLCANCHRKLEWELRSRGPTDKTPGYEPGN